MNLLIKSISISLLSLLGMKTALAESELIRELPPVQYAGNPSTPGDMSHPVGGQYDSGSLAGQEDVSSLMQREWAYSSERAKAVESRLTPEQRQALRHEIREVGRELYSQK
jgi:hypothetical protein